METNKSPVVSALSSQVPNAGQGREDSSSVQLWELAGCCSEAPRRSHSWLLQAGPEHSQSTPTLRSGYRAGDSVNQHTAKLSRLFLIRVSNRDIVSRSSIIIFLGFFRYFTIPWAQVFCYQWVNMGRTLFSWWCKFFIFEINRNIISLLQGVIKPSFRLKSSDIKSSVDNCNYRKSLLCVWYPYCRVSLIFSGE